MLYLLLTILLNTVIFILFKLFPKYDVNTMQAITVNYLTCVATGSVFLGRFPLTSESVKQEWFPWALLLGLMFISIFNFMAYCTQRFGITTATVANKLSLVIPVAFSVVLYHERLSLWNVTGLLLAFPAVYYSTRVAGGRDGAGNLTIPALLFLVCGALDTLVKFAEYNFLQESGLQIIFPIYVFAIAAITGIVLVTTAAVQNKVAIQLRSIIAGVILGVPNYFSIYYFIRLLHSGFMKSSSAIPVNNIAIVFACAFAGMVLFGEQANRSRFVGLTLAIISIILISLNS